eukprot:Protomagalhaensia_sp_Gyna_25__5510@NODE_739_length_2717_cov_42_019417_g578_i0_p3_GENE_NODE_739_length_2717_cov_42_019417_g578_i0NODE_739_length_2717_cov_42_019417_g578_i0_p3_ORF_typecomplete_len144_score6_95DUF4702/PF15774_5/0_23_NODE_739_length_2717_cov_42_019417_g578_i013151746
MGEQPMPAVLPVATPTTSPRTIRSRGPPGTCNYNGPLPSPMCLAIQGIYAMLVNKATELVGWENTDLLKKWAGVPLADVSNKHTLFTTHTCHTYSYTHAHVQWHTRTSICMSTPLFQIHQLFASEYGIDLQGANCFGFPDIPT